MKADPKKVAALIIAAKKPEAKKEEGNDVQEDGYKEGKAEAAKEMMDALKGGDHDAFAESLQNFIEMCD